MNSIYVLKKSLIPNQNTILTSVTDLNKLINQNRIKDYDKFEKVNGHVYLICCDKKDSISPLSDGDKGMGYKDGLVFKVNRFMQTPGRLLAFGGIRGNGVYGTNFRIATKEEVENYKR